MLGLGKDGKTQKHSEKRKKKTAHDGTSSAARTLPARDVASNVSAFGL